ncbi:uncharacterized protein LOC127835106 isoform X2 [Dreissena polymorpha]|uniref:uncharacterized protein LOC127835106 isoform X2 n=1 Tax=Dreissena polymorpha TaxID=45954 RepID=UPI0022642B74|nr:uncharacterized protein LOC127835106 isoform X2 [Dreissena polymorpha]
MWNLVLCGISGILLGLLISMERSKYYSDETLLERVNRNELLLKGALEKLTETNAKVENTFMKLKEVNADAEIKLNNVINIMEIKRHETLVRIKEVNADAEVKLNNAINNMEIKRQDTLVRIKEVNADADAKINNTIKLLEMKRQATLERIQEVTADAEVKLNNAIQNLEIKGQDLEKKVEAFIHSVTVEDNAAYFNSLVIQTDNELKAKTRYFDQTVGAFIESASQNEYRAVTDKKSAVLLLVKRSAGEFDIMKAHAPLINFQAVLDLSDDSHFSTNDAFEFKNVLANAGGGYNPATGLFTAPVAGVYIFTVQHCPYYHGDAGFEIVQEGKALKRSIHKSWGEFTICVNMQIVSKVAEGDRVWVRSTYYDSIKYPDDIRWHSFSGLLIHSMEK